MIVWSRPAGARRMWLIGMGGMVAIGELGYFLAQAATGESPKLWEYGAIGALAILLVGAVKVLWTAATKSMADALAEAKQTLEHERARAKEAEARERARADRLEDELRKQNAFIQERTLTTLADATRAVQEAMSWRK